MLESCIKVKDGFSRKRVELKCLATIIFSVFRRVKSRKVVLDIDSPRQNPQKN